MLRIAIVLVVFSEASEIPGLRQQIFTPTEMGIRRI